MPKNGKDLPLLEVSEKDILSAAKEIRGKQQANKKETRGKREQTLRTKQAALPDKKYGLILADLLYLPPLVALFQASLLEIFHQPSHLRTLLDTLKRAAKIKTADDCRAA